MLGDAKDIYQTLLLFGGLSLIVAGLYVAISSTGLPYQDILSKIMVILGLLSGFSPFAWVYIENMDEVSASALLKRLRIALGIVIAFPGAVISFLGVSMFFGAPGTESASIPFKLLLIVSGLIIIGLGALVGGKEVSDAWIFMG